MYNYIYAYYKKNMYLIRPISFFGEHKTDKPFDHKTFQF